MEYTVLHYNLSFQDIRILLARLHFLSVFLDQIKMGNILIAFQIINLFNSQNML